MTFPGLNTCSSSRLNRHEHMQERDICHTHRHWSCNVTNLTIAHAVISVSWVTGTHRRLPACGGGIPAAWQTCRPPSWAAWLRCGDWFALVPQMLAFFGNSGDEEPEADEHRDVATRVVAIASSSSSSASCLHCSLRRAPPSRALTPEQWCRMHASSQVTCRTEEHVLCCSSIIIT